MYIPYDRFCLPARNEINNWKIIEWSLKPKKVLVLEITTCYTQCITARQKCERGFPDVDKNELTR